MTDTEQKDLTLTSRIAGTTHVSWRELKFIQQENFKEWTVSEKEKLKNSLKQNQFADPFKVWKNGNDYYCLDGKHRTLALAELEADGVRVPATLPALLINCTDAADAAKMVLLYSSMYARITGDGLTEFIKLYDLQADELLSEMNLPELDMSTLSLIEDAGDSEKSYQAFKSLQERFVVPPFSVLDTRQGYWQERKKKWHDLGINSQATREDVELIAVSGQSSAIYELRNKMRDDMHREPSWPEIIAEAKRRGLHLYEGASVFDPVLSEVAYRWFCPKKAIIGDPFAGGSVRGIVASLLGHDYHGIDLRSDQVTANQEQLVALRDVDSITDAGRGQVKWYQGDSRNVNGLLPTELMLDYLFSCPPYHDLEQYSEDPNDLSNMTYAEFIKVYTEIIRLWVGRLKENRFACFVVSEIRDKKGVYKNFVSDTIAAFVDAGCKYYNEIVLVNVADSLPIRVGKQFTGSRKVGRTHQNVLVFYKGDTAAIRTEFPEIKVDEIPSEVLDIS